MNKRKKIKTLVELGKDILIIVLIFSALWMLGSGTMGQRLDLGRQDLPQIQETQSSPAEQMGMNRPLRLTVTLQGGSEPIRYSAQNDAGTVDILFQQTAGLLMETLSSAEPPQQISRMEWEWALGRAPGMCYDFQGEIPLSVLSGWMNVELSIPDAVVRRVLLTVWEGSAALYYYDIAAETWCRCVTQVVGELQLENVLSGLSGNGAYYAFESELSAQMDADTLLLPNPAPLPVCSAANPMSAGRASLEARMDELGFNLAGCVFYSGAGEEVGRSGSDTVRLSKEGVVEYHSGEVDSGQFSVNSVPGQSRVFSVVDRCGQLLQQAMGERCGQVRTYLSVVEQRGEDEWYLEFEYSLSGVPVRFQNGAAASFYVDNGHITEFTLRLRSYTPGEEVQILLPPEQAAAAMSALNLEGQELQVTYQDRGEDRVLPNWTAVFGEAG